MTQRFAPILLSMLTLLSACGGGGSDSPATTSSVPAAGPRLAINQANHQQVAGGSVTGVNQVSGLSSTAALVGVQTSAAANLSAALRSSLLHLQPLTSGPAVLTGAVLNRSANCAVSGTVSASFDDRNGNQIFDAAGESVTLTLSNCNDGTGQTLNGTVFFSLNLALTGDLTTARYSIDANVGFADFTIASGGLTVGARGNIQLVASAQSATQSSTRLLIPALAFSLSSGSTTLSLTVHDADLLDTLNGTTVSSTYSATITSSEFSGRSVRIITTTPIMTDIGAVYPRAGTLLITGLNGSQIRITAQTDASNLTLELDADGNNTYETTSTVAWSTLI